MLLSDALETVEDFILNLILNLITILLSPLPAAPLLTQRSG